MRNNLYRETYRNFPTLVDLLSYRAQVQPNQQALTFVTDGEAACISLTYFELHQKAQAIAAMLQSMNAMGERALLLYPSGLEYIAAFFGCLYAGVVAVTVYPPRRNHHMKRLLAIALDAQAKFALTTTFIERSLKEESELTAIHCITTDHIASNLACNWQPPILDGNTLAYLQYTSGSTGTPKGVMVSHNNLLHNLGLIKQYFDHRPDDSYVSWLPLHHDLGLINGVLEPIYCGLPVTLMSPVAFQQKPIRWLQAISRYKATTSGGPNSAYNLCVSKITPEQRSTLDLSSWKIAFNAAEPIHSETLERFVAAFAPYGFQKSAFYPCYGQAEATLYVSGSWRDRLPKLQTVDRTAFEQNQVVVVHADDLGAWKLAGSGQARLGVNIVIVSPESLTRCDCDQVGEIWVSSPSTACGYWQRPVETKHTFDAYLADTGASEAGQSLGPFLRTGDLGFMHDGELFVTGRLKDLIIIWGRNHYPQDIELTVENSHPSVRPNCSGAFSLEVNSSEQLVVVAEIERTHLRSVNVDEVVAAIRQAVSEEHELQVYAVALLKTASIPKTSSGKIQRRACRIGFVEDSLEIVASWKASDEPETVIESRGTHSDVKISFPTTVQDIETWIKDWLVRNLKVDAQLFNPSKSLSAYGMDSMTAVEFAQDLESWIVSLKLEANIVWKFPTIESLVHQLADELRILTVEAIANSTQPLKTRAKVSGLQRLKSGASHFCRNTDS
jgi:acyl-CoA synthetase (AMP-forming)/AMP-acid ligase II/acyl carrier protein